MSSHLMLFAARDCESRQIAEETLQAMGVRDPSDKRYRYCTADTETAAFAVPEDCDYHGYVPDQGLPAWVRVWSLSPGTRAQLREDWCDTRGSASDYVLACAHKATHLIQIIGLGGEQHQREAVHALAGCVGGFRLDTSQVILAIDEHQF